MDISSFKMPKPNRKVHSELHEIVDILRKEFGETAAKGKGSFGFYLKLLKNIPCGTLRLWLADIQNSPNLTTKEAKLKVFWWKWKNNRPKA